MLPTNLKKFKDTKKYKKIIEDIDSMLQIFILTEKGLYFFRHYVAAQEVLSLVQANKAYLEMSKKKYEDLIK